MHLMLDLETFDSGPCAAIVQIGAVLFDMDGKDPTWDDTFEVNVSLQSSILAGLEVSDDTIKWWREQHPQARRGISNKACDLACALVKFNDWLLQGVGDLTHLDGVWGHGATFDPVIMKSAYDASKIMCPWDFRKVRDTRTMIFIADTLGVKLREWDESVYGIRHNGASDALFQANQMRDIMIHLVVAG